MIHVIGATMGADAATPGVRPGRHRDHRSVRSVSGPGPGRPEVSDVALTTLRHHPAARSANRADALASAPLWGDDGYSVEPCPEELSCR
ncbi:hypothetical protein Ae406Ps2_4303c [Pseudonocardia sp. Ae406_Ps2]|nr:hypothetical protein Ae331Ps2_1655 [Pseudonocardia sp. Ae331_Ps2]OLM04303.1 hypothetical protein Ae406Ps2_4303c [Pseudonocardia sp. Ae406_Ps2]OLM10861.1 hypothetical protein Ae505Ps2_0984 [Pseudonocardia sp. Ae505_Ps2]OLM25864.1 hypothetical protein Ae706Ps2_4297c [Pseudonocardia sp. Ae706_Ps2]